ncbi:MAG: 3-hydroxyacyl-CoA dehydrogenase NAD-binding domain-containing protein [Acidobacteriota bacterium]|nr:3-hydroxyacyl-CoA dehydrogenase NAD-binding domain-containing protein [Acidobacteriota bacterium]
MTSARPASEGADPEASVHTVAVIGAGSAGRDFAVRCAVAGYEVILEDVMPARLRDAEQDFRTVAPRLAGGSLRLALTVEDAVRTADLAIDFVPDELESKLEIFCMIDRMAPPKTILVTPTDALSITDLASCTYRPDRCFALRGPLTGAAVVPITLIVPTCAAPAELAAAERFLRRLGLNPERQADSDAPLLRRNYL